MGELELVVNRKGLKLVIENKSWCRVYLIDNEIVVMLGANSLEKIVSKLLIAFVNMENKKYFTYQGIKMFTVLNMMEPHSVIAGKLRNDLGLELVVLDKEGNIVPIVSLLMENIVEWIEKLTIFMINYTDS